jgi:hypothetical protein
LEEALDEGEGSVGDHSPSVVDGEGMAAVLDLDDLPDAIVVFLLLVRGIGDRPRERYSPTPDMISSGPRSGLHRPDLGGATLIYGTNDAVVVDPPLTTDQAASVGDGSRPAGRT